LKVVFARRALDQLEEIFSYIAADNPLAAARVVERIRAAAVLLETFPELGRVTDRTGVRVTALPDFPYLLFYSVDQHRQQVLVLKVLHAARNR
jgi:toxin ParE1/3/4